MRCTRLGSARIPLCSLLGTTLLIAAFIPLTASAGSDRSRAYVGIGYGQEIVRFEVRRQGRTNTSARFKAENAGLVCEDSTFPRIDFPPIKLPFLSPTVFQGQRYERKRNGDWSYYEVKGRLVGPRRAIGYLYYIEDPFDPPGTENRPECSTGGQLYHTWKARRGR